MFIFDQIFDFSEADYLADNDDFPMIFFGPM